MRHSLFPERAGPLSRLALTRTLFANSLCPLSKQNYTPEREGSSPEDEARRYRAARFAARMVLTALDQTFINAKEVMSWLSECAQKGTAKGWNAVG